jgi:FMN-dependent oxidoreductase (nitrilotriacetate monooxygenase family)
MMTRKMKLGLFLLPAGHHLSAWRVPGNVASAIDFPQILDLAKVAEAAKMDAVFLADVDGLWGTKWEAMEKDPGTFFLEPFTLLSAIAGATKRIGLIGSASTLYNEPFHIARKFSSLDHISGGRAAWNIVTSFMPHNAANFGIETYPDHSERYNAAAEFVDVTQKLWDSWDEGAVVRDQASGLFIDRTKMRLPAHEGQYFRCAGPLNLPRSPQGHPVLVQAGSSPDGRQFASTYSEVIFTVQSVLEDAQAFYSDMQQRLEAEGRPPRSSLIMPGAFIMAGASEAEARERFEEMQAFVDPMNGLAALQNYGFGIDLEQHPWDSPFPELPPTEGQQGRREVVMAMARRENMTVRQVCQRMAVTRGHFFVLGTATQIADQLEEWFTGGAADGFNLMLPSFPDSLDAFVRHVIPELQRRGLFRSEYEGVTLRDNLGLPPARSVYA